MTDKFEDIQVIQHMDNGDIKVFEIKDAHLGDENDPLTTIELTGNMKLVTPPNQERRA